jgi:RNA polymerase sigma factor (sigma-70 family)
MTDYRITVKVRNARLLRAIETAGHQSGQKFAQRLGISYSSHLLPYLNLTRSPFDEDGHLRPCAEKLCVFFNKRFDELWSDDQCVPLDHNTSEVELSARGVQALMSAERRFQPEFVLEQQQAVTAVDGLLQKLPPREANVLRLRYGIGGEAQTLEQVVKQLGITRERVRQVEIKALKKLRAPGLGAGDIARTHYDMEGDSDAGFQ